MEGGGSGGGDDANEKRTKTTSAVPLDEWTHLVGIMDGPAQEIHLYRDGVFQETIALGYSTIAFGSEALALGRHSYFRTRYYDGRIDELAIFNDEVPSADEIRKLYEVGLDGRSIL